MSQTGKILVATIFFAIYDPSLIYVYFTPQEVSTLGIGHSFRKILLLDRNLAPTVFTLGMGILFSIIALVGMFKFVTTSDD